MIFAMTRRLILAIILSLPLMAGAQKYAVVDIDSIVSQLPEVKDAQVALDAASATFQTEFNTLCLELDKKYTEYRQLPSTTSEEIHKRRIQELQTLDQKIKQFRQAADQDLQRQQQMLMAPILNRINAAIDEICRQSGYTVIFRSSAPLYTDPSVTDLNPIVIEYLRQQQLPD